MSFPSVFFVFAVVGLSMLGAEGLRAAGLPPRFESCHIEHASGLKSFEAECARLRVPENTAQADGRLIELRIARVPAINRRKRPDPLFVLAGGPGMAAADFYASVGPALARIQRDRDIVLLDQRGTGASNPLTCELDEDVVLSASSEVIAAETKRCLTSLSTRADPRFYTTSVAVQDLDRVRSVLGYQTINLYGVSYGTRVAQHYARRFTAHTRSMILDGVVPPQVALGPSIAFDAEAALKGIFARCARDAGCYARFGDPAESYLALWNSLRAASVKVELPDPSTGDKRRLDFGPLHLATVLRLASYSSDQAALLPLSLELARQEANFVPLAAQFLLISRSLAGELAYGMHNSVVCTEDVPFYEPSLIDRRALEDTYLGTTQLDALVEICKLWPRGPIDADFREPVRAGLPVLLLSGGNDPVTPAANAEKVKARLSDSMHVVLPDQGHGQLIAPCVDRLMAQFLELGSTRGLDVSCTRKIKPAPFFTTLAGPAP